MDDVGTRARRLRAPTSHVDRVEGCLHSLPRQPPSPQRFQAGDMPEKVVLDPVALEGRDGLEQELRRRQRDLMAPGGQAVTEVRVVEGAEVPRIDHGDLQGPTSFDSDTS